MEPSLDDAPGTGGAAPPVRLTLPRFQLGAVGAAHEPVVEPPVVEPWTPTPGPAPHVGPAQAHAHDHAHAHAHDHAHAHAHAHAHSHAAGACEGGHGLFDSHQHDWSHLAMQPRSRRILKLALAVQFAFLVAEVVGGIVTNSLALLSDAAHMLADVGALALALFAANLAARAVDERRTWGMPRAELIAAAFNSATLVVSCAWIAYEGVRRLFEPEEVAGTGLIAIAVAGLLANLLGAWLLARADQDNLNVRAAMLHLLVDAASSVGVIVAGIVIAMGGPVLVDTVASLLIAFVAIRGTWPVLRAALDSLVDAAPPGVTATDVARVLSGAPSVTQVHDVHVWEPGPRRMAATAHVLVLPGVDIGSAIRDLRSLLLQQLGIDHVTLQVAPDRAQALLQVEPTLPRDAAIDRAVQLARSERPTLDPAVVRAIVAQRAAAAPADARLSPVRLAADAVRVTPA
jgi:cobalt-zinc-cadmium efflux system protein